MKSLIPFSIIAILIFSAARFPVTRNISSPYLFGLSQRAEADTIPPIQDRTGDFLRNPNTNPIDLKDPKSIEKKVELDPVTGRYILSEKIGDEDFRPSTFMSFEEYLEYRRKQDERDYFNYLSGATSDGKINSLDPISKIDVQNSLIDRLFGGTEVDIKPQGNIDLTFGFDIQRLENPILLERQRTTGGFNFDMAIQMNVTGKIGSKLTLSTNYNTNATFNFDNQIKINYNTDALTDPFSEDAIIKKIEAGNVSLPLRGTLIQGAQSLFGVKTELQFGRLRLTSVISQQNSQKKNLKVEGGSQLQEFEVRADEYDENRHFFLSFYNQETFEDNLSNLPQVRSLFKLENIEVWITNNRNEVDDVREIVAFADLAEPSRLVSPDKVNAPAIPVYPDISRNRGLPSNDANDLYARVTSDPMLRQIDNVVAGLQGASFDMVQAQDFEKVFARKLKPSEFTVNQELGFVSLGVNVQPDQVVAVTYSYSYNGKLYFVGDRPENIATTTIDSVPQVLFAKMLKSTVQRTDVPTWELMMKNVYPIGAYQVDPKEFRLDVFYEDPGKGIKRFLPFSNLEGRPLLRVFQLDKLNTQGDPQPDGIFDFVPGVTINTRNGRVMFPVLEPFGRSLGAQIDDPALRDSLVYQALYDSTLFQAREFPEKNRFIIKGSYKSSVSAEISLGAFNIPPGSVSVTAGGQRLIEGQDYEIDYNIGRVRILNDALLQSGVPVNVSYEDNTLFGFQTKTMLGLRADYEISKKLNLGATFMQLFERPFTPKVNIGDDPINNRIYGFDINYSTDAPLLTKIADALPLISTKAPSSFNFSGEAALLAPGNARAINQNRNEKEGVVYIDDFEGTSAGLDLRQPVNQWFLSSVPQNNTSTNRWPEGNLINDVAGGANRAKLNWYRIDLGVRNREDERNPYTSLVDQNEVFPNINVTPDQLPNVQTFDLTYYPRERGPYNFDLPGGYPGFTSGITFDGDSLLLNDPETRWGGIMRSLNTVDFQTANIEYLEFWMLSPFINPEDPNSSLPPDQLDALEGSLYFHLGNLSEDILRDSRKFFENGLPTTFNPNRQTDTTAWGIVPVAPQITRFFDNDRQGGTESRQQQDVGLDGLSDDGEREHFSSYIEAVRAVNPAVAAKLERDPSNDNFRYFRDDSFNDTDGILQRYRDFNNPQGNSPENTGQAFIFSSTNIPDAEDLNQDNTLNETEAYFQYRVPIFYDRSNPKEIDMNTTPFITDRRAANNGRVWYRFRIPLSNTNSQYSQPIGGIRDFRSIRFMRMIMKDFAKPVTLRFATLELVRNQWRRYQQDLSPETSCQDEPVEFNIDAVNIEENIGRQPFNYVLPLGIQRERSLGVFNALQNEQSLSLNVKKLCDGEDVAVFKTINLDLRVYEKLRMFTHAEAKNPAQQIDPGDLSIFVRIGSDFKNNYYEYEIPLVMSDPNALPANPNSEEYKLEVWRPENEFDFALELLRNIKEERNQANIPLDVEYVRAVEGRFPGLSHQVKVRGNPNLGLAKQIMVGVRNPAGGNNSSFDFEAWINELRLVGLDDRAAGAAVARADIQMADLASFTVSANYSSIGFGALNQKVAERSREAVYGYDFAANVQLNKFLPEKWGINLPFYGQLSNVTRRPEYDPFDLDVPLKLKLSGEDDIAARDSIRNLALDVTRLRSVNFTNVRKEKTGSTAPPKPWDISNFSANYSYTQTDRSNPLIESDAEDRTTGGIDYAYSKPVKYLEPFKNLIKNDKFLKLITSFNFNPIPNALTFRTVMNRQFAETRYRFTGLPDRFSTFYNKRFTWDRDVNLQWDMAKALKFNFSARTNAVVDEPDESWMQDSPFITDINQFRKDSIWSSIRNLGRIKNYAHNFNLNYTLPTKAIPFMDWVQVRAQYQAEYNWTAIALNVDSLGNVVQNKQRRQLNADFNFDNLYGKIGYLRNIERPATQPKKKSDKDDPNADPKTKVEGMAANTKEDKKKDERMPSAIERALIRPLLMLRKARFTWSEDFSTSLPGFMQQAGILGMGNGFSGPGWDFIAGLQPNIRTLDESNYYSASDWLHQVGNNKGWLSASVFQNREVLQDYSQKFDGRITIEPYRDFRIEVDITRNYTEGHAQFFKDTIADGVSSLVHAIPKKNGSMAISYFALGTPMTTDAAEIRRLFGIFDQNRTIISQRLGQGPHTIDSLAARGYTLGYGNIQNEVILPAFIAAYTGKDAQTVGLDIFKTLPSPSWRLNYNGLSKLPWFSDVFQNFSLTHGYKGTLTVNRFDTNPLWLDTRNQFGPDPISGNFYARFLIPEVVIQEAFSPLIAVDATLKNGMSFRLDYKRSRTLGMSFVSYQLAETQSKEITIGFGYLLRDFDIPFLTGSNKKGAKKPEPKNNTQQQQNNNRGGGNRGGGQLRSRDLDFNFNMSLRDDVTFNHLLDQGIIEPVRGNYALNISPSAEYQINTRLGLRLFFDYRQNIPRTSAGFPRIDTSGGLVVRFKLI